jgi:hypothetical protein
MKVAPQIILFLALSLWIAGNISCQKIPEDYLLGEWETTDSTTGEKKLVTFKENKTLVFHSEKTEWVYTYQIKDSIISLDYTLYDKNITGRASGILLLRNDDCFWWFHPLIYETYQRRLKMGHHISMPDQFQLFLKEYRGVYYRIRKE